MKEYEILAKNWNEAHDDLEWTGDSDYAETYEEAVKIAKRLSKQYVRCDIELYATSDELDEEDSQEQWDYNRTGCLRWTESYEKGKQVPVFYYNGVTPIWRSAAGFIKDLKPKRNRK